MLGRLASATGSLLDDTELIDVLATIKLKSKEVNEKLLEAKDKRIHGADSGMGRTSGERALEIFFMGSLSWFFSGSQVNFVLI